MLNYNNIQNFIELFNNILYDGIDTAKLTLDQKNVLKEIGSFAGGVGAMFAGLVNGQDGQELIDNIYDGQRLGKNAVENNYLLPQEKGDLIKELKNCNGDKSCEKNIQNEYEKISKPRDKEFYEAYISCRNEENCTNFEKLHYDLRKELTEEGNEYFKDHKDEFKKLDESASIYHNFQKDSETGEVINVLTGSEDGVKKYVHPIYGYEVVLDKNNNIITDPVNMGTYNFYNPYSGVDNNLIEDKNDFVNTYFGKHFKYDVAPYYLKGNLKMDQTTESQRFLRNIYFIIKKNK